MSNDDTNVALSRLAKTIQQLVQDQLSSGTAEPEEQLLFQWKCKDFKYTEKGADDGGSTGDYIHRKSWIQATVLLLQKVSSLSIFSEAQNVIAAAVPKAPDPNHILRLYCQHVLAICLEANGHPTTAFIETITKQLLKDLQNLPITFRSKVDLVGMTLESESINLGDGVVIRQTRQRDLEIPAPVLPHGFGVDQDRFNRPSAILEIELQTDPQPTGILQRKVERYIAILRLFDVGGVRAIRYTLSSDSILQPAAGTLTSNPALLSAREISFIKKTDEDRLKRFCQTLSIALPKDLHDSSSPMTSLVIAHDRYKEALFESKLFESRIATAMMGLEALFLEETHELSFRLGMRVSKTMSFLNRDAFEVRDFMKTAYSIRSTFAHGSLLSYKERRLENKFKDLNAIVRAILDYLRLGILTSILTKVSKEELLDLIDDSLIDGKKSAELESRLREVRDL